MNKTYIGIDNGVSGTIAILSEDKSPIFAPTPVFKQQDYVKKKKIVSRIFIKGLYDMLEPHREGAFILIERPMINPTHWIASLSAIRAHEATLGVIELLGIPYQFIDSKEWQTKMLPSGYHKEELKKISLEIGNRLFPQFAEHKHPDRDSLLMAEYARRMKF